MRTQCKLMTISCHIVCCCLMKNMHNHLKKCAANNDSPTLVQRVKPYLSVHFRTSDFRLNFSHLQDKWHALKGGSFTAWRTILEAACSGHLHATDPPEAVLHVSFNFFLVPSPPYSDWLTDRFSSLAQTHIKAKKPINPTVRRLDGGRPVRSWVGSRHF